MALITVSKPTIAQVKKGVSRVALVFVIAAVAYLKATPDPLTTVALEGAIYAGAVAIFQALESIFTTL
jgi:hypothetical protein